MKKIKRLALTAALALAGVVQAEDIHWVGGASGGTSAWEDPVSWHNAHQGGAAGLPVVGDSLFIQQSFFGGSGNDTINLPVLSSTTPVLGDVYLSLQPTTPAQYGQLDIVSSGNFSAANLVLARAGGSMAVLNMSGTATAAVNGFFLADTAGAGTALINLSDSASLNILIDTIDGAGTWSMVMDGSATFTSAGADLAWANTLITSLNGSDSIQVADIGGGNLQYTVIPEPSTLGLFALMGGGMMWFRKRFWA